MKEEAKPLPFKLRAPTEQLDVDIGTADTADALIVAHLKCIVKQLQILIERKYASEEQIETTGPLLVEIPEILLPLAQEPGTVPSQPKRGGNESNDRVTRKSP